MNNVCLTAAPESPGNTGKTPMATTTCAGTPGPPATWMYGAHGSILNDATGQCLYTPGGHVPGHRVQLRDCTGKADRWR
ncbi:ricin-type beta-trefoil lectin domain protein [Streptomyces sp. NPDC051664]|uniref:ricin-type beta-trefoil lectin domain protein n=1 Tax=Streptomyces sp. NPDC051664 TaxID=3365668 RepID=UPI0037B3BA57